MKNQTRTIITGCVLGAIVGLLLWVFLYLMNECTHFIWNYIPSKLQFKYYPVIVCLMGGVSIGLLQKKYGEYPKELSEVMDEYKRDKTTRYDIIHIIALAAFLPLVFGGSIGPEAGLTGIIVGLCCYVNDRIKFVSRQNFDFREIGISDTLAVVFGAPLFALITPGEQKDELPIPRKLKNVINLASVLCALATYMILKNLIGGGMEISRFSHISTSNKELIAYVPLILFGCVLGYIFLFIGRLINVIFKPLHHFPIIKTVLGGFILGLAGVYIPYAMFSGELQLGELQTGWTTISVAILLFIGLMKLLITELCISSGWRGGKIFPIVFSAACFGYAVSATFSINPEFCIAVVSATLLAIVLRRPLIVCALLLLCFPIDAVLPILLAALLGTIIPIPKFLTSKENKADEKD